jgi:hypothetical protein
VYVTDTGGQSRRRSDWRSTSTSFLLGAASGMATNLVTGATAYRVIAATVTLMAILVASTRLRALPWGAPIVRYGVRLMQILGLGAAVLAAVGPASLTPYMIFIAVGLTAGAVLVPADATLRFHMLGGMALVGFGSALLGVGIFLLVNASDEPFNCVLTIGAGTAVVGLGMAYVAGRPRAMGAALIGFATPAAASGVLEIAAGNYLFGPAMAGVAATIAGLGAALLWNRIHFAWALLASAGMSVVGFGAVYLINYTAGTAIRIIGFGMAMFAIGAANLKRSFIGWAFIGTAAVGLGLGNLFLASRELELTWICLAVGMIAAGLGAALLSNREDVTRLLFIGVGVAIIGLGTAYPFYDGFSAAIRVIGFGVAVIGLGTAYLADIDLFGGAAFICLAVVSGDVGVTAISFVAARWYGFGTLDNLELLFGLAFIGCAAASAGLGIVRILNSERGTRAKQWLDLLARDAGESPNHRW